MAECACVLIVSAALAKSFDAVVYYEDGDLLYTVDQLVKEAKEALPEVESASRRHSPSLPAASIKPWWKLW